MLVNVCRLAIPHKTYTVFVASYIHTYIYVICYFIGVTDLQVMNIFDCNTNTFDITVRWDAANSPYCGGVLYYIVMIYVLLTLTPSHICAMLLVEFY